MFLLLRDRLADRVLHPLYLGQILVFAGLLLVEMRKSAQRKRTIWALAGLSVLVLTVCVPQAVQTLHGVSKEYARREEVNQTNQEVLTYCSLHPGRLYLEDVYSTVAYSEKICVDRDKPFNCDLLGGWLVKSPLTQEKLGAFGYASMEEAVCAGANVSLLAETKNDMQWLREYFAWRQLPLQVVKTGTVADGVDVYQVLPQNTGERIE